MIALWVTAFFAVLQGLLRSRLRKCGLFASDNGRFPEAINGHC